MVGRFAADEKECRALALLLLHACFPCYYESIDITNDSENRSVSDEAVLF